MEKSNDKFIVVWVKIPRGEVSYMEIDGIFDTFEEAKEYVDNCKYPFLYVHRISPPLYLSESAKEDKEKKNK